MDAELSSRWVPASSNICTTWTTGTSYALQTDGGTRHLIACATPLQLLG